MRASWKTLVGLALCASSLTWSAVGCSDDTTQTNNSAGNECAAGETKNPITGDCVPSRTSDNRRPGENGVTGPNTTTNANSGENMMPGVMVDPDMPRKQVDVPEADRCKDGLDSDSDGLENDCECELGTEPGDSDTDADGLPDGFEDRNLNCMTDQDETQPTAPDTDSDGLDDGTEYRDELDPLKRDTDEDGLPDGIEAASCTDPKLADTDDDGLSDGAEDPNGDGVIGTCPADAYSDSCAMGESNPCSPDTDGDGIPDSQEVSLLGCRQEFLDDLPMLNLVTNMTGDYQLSIDPEATAAEVTGQAQGAASVFDHSAQGYSGFVISLPTAQNVPTRALRDNVVNQIQGSLFSARVEANGRQVQTHDNHDALAQIKIDLGTNASPGALRDQLLRALAGNSATHTQTETYAQTTSGALAIAGLVNRNSHYVVTVAIVDRQAYEALDRKTGWLVDDVTSSMSVADSTNELEPACVDLQADDKPKVDYLWVIDGSGSMQEENARVKQFANEFVGILDQRNIDYRLGVTSAHCYKIWEETDIPPGIKALFGTPNDGNPCAPPDLPFPIPGGIDSLLDLPYKNGKLCDKNGAFYTSDPAKFAACVDEMASQSSSNEHTSTISTAALARSLPREDNNPAKLRTDAATVVISVTDEFDDFFQFKLGWEDAGNSDSNTPPQDPTTYPSFDAARLDAQVQPFVNYLLSSEYAATLFGIIWIPGQQDSCGAAEAAAGIERIATKTGGTVGSLCGGQSLQNTLQQIAAASAGLASGLRLRGIPAPQSIVVRIGRDQQMTIDVIPRARDNGWDYDQVTNAALFLGNAIPRPSDRVVIAYRRWRGSIRGCMSNSDCPTYQKFRCINNECR